MTIIASYNTQDGTNVIYSNYDVKIYAENYDSIAGKAFPTSYSDLAVMPQLPPTVTRLGRVKIHDLDACISAREHFATLFKGVERLAEKK